MCEKFFKVKECKPSMVRRYQAYFQHPFPEAFVMFICENNGGIPVNDAVNVEGKEYEFRCLLSFRDGNGRSYGSHVGL